MNNQRDKYPPPPYRAKASPPPCYLASQYVPSPLVIPPFVHDHEIPLAPVTAPPASQQEVEPNLHTEPQEVTPAPTATPPASQEEVGPNLHQEPQQVNPETPPPSYIRSQIFSIKIFATRKKTPRTTARDEDLEEQSVDEDPVTALKWVGGAYLVVFIAAMVLTILLCWDSRRDSSDAQQTSTHGQQTSADSQLLYRALYGPPY